MYKYNVTCKYYASNNVLYQYIVCKVYTRYSMYKNRHMSPVAVQVVAHIITWWAQKWYQVPGIYLVGVNRAVVPLWEPIMGHGGSQPIELNRLRLISIRIVPGILYVYKVYTRYSMYKNRHRSPVAVQVVAHIITWWAQKWYQVPGIYLVGVKRAAVPLWEPIMGHEGSQPIELNRLRLIICHRTISLVS